MNRCCNAILFAAAILAPFRVASARDNPKVWSDLGGDAVIRRTDAGIIGELGPDCVLPNLLRLTVGAWQSATASTNPYSGSYVDPDGAHLLRFDLEIKGLVNPPGSVSPSSYAPFIFGPSPLLGSIEFDIDGDRDTGGELGGTARSRFLANIGRFGRAPYGSIGSRAPRFGWEIDSDFFTAPQFERSGADFVLAFCGCYPTSIVSQTGNTNGIFESGETWIIQGGFFQRAGGFQSICSSFGGSGGLQPGLYVPSVRLRWSHDPAAGTTMITLVFATTMTGAGQLAGQPAQPVNLNAGDQASLVEALADLISSAGFAIPGTPAWHLANRWQGQNPQDSRHWEPDRWGVHAIVGTAYASPLQGALFAWTDTGFEDVLRDLDGNGIAGPEDKQIVYQAIDALDGTIRDAEGEGSENGNVRLIDPGYNFAIADTNGDGNINRFDVNFLCPGDFNQDGTINILDYITFFNAFSVGDPRADLNVNGALETGDFVTFLNATAAGC